MRHWMLVVFVIAALGGAGCAGPAKLAQKSENKLAEGDVWKAWQLATKALDKAPANARARRAAAAAATTIADDWQRRISAQAQSDSMAAAEDVLKFARFRSEATRYTTVRTTPEWMASETRLRQGAARRHYAEGFAAAGSGRPKKAYVQFREAQRFVADYRDAAARADAALDQAVTRVAIVPFRSRPETPSIGREVAAAWSDALLEHMATDESFTRIVPRGELDRQVRVSELASASRADAIRIGGRANADRVVWGDVGRIDSETSFQVFRRTVWRSATVNGARRWVEVPIHVIARIRTVRVDLAYEVISSRNGATLARETIPRTLEAHAVWTDYIPEGDVGSYALITDEFRAADPDLARRIEFEWQSTVGAGTTLAQVLAAKQASGRHAPARAAAPARYAAGAAFVFLDELPSATELAQAALAGSWPSVERSLAGLDGIDDIDLRAASTGESDSR